MPPAALDIICASLADNSLKQYEVAFKRWSKFCNDNQIDFYEASIPNVIYFLTKVFNEGTQYGTVNCIRSALSLILGSKISSDDRVQRLFKGFYRLRPPMPKYDSTWDPSIVLDYLSINYPNDLTSLASVTKKTVTLLALVTAHRMQTISKIKILNIDFNNPDHISIKIPDLIKSSRLGASQPNLILPFFVDRPTICPALALKRYLDMTQALRGDIDTLFISIKKPYRPVTAQTLGRWVKDILGESGIDTSMFTAHSARHAATSSAHRHGVNINTIRSTAGWSGNSQVFARFYQRNIVTNSSNQFALSLINSSDTAQ